MQHCPVCLGRVSSELFSSHMNSHSKDDVVSALLRQPLPGSLQSLQSFTAPSLLQASNPGSNPALPTSIQNQVQNTLQAALSAPRTNVASGSAPPDLTSQGRYLGTRYLFQFRRYFGISTTYLSSEVEVSYKDKIRSRTKLPALIFILLITIHQIEKQNVFHKTI